METRDLERMVDELATVFPSEIALADFQSIAGQYACAAGASRVLKERGHTSMTPTRVFRLAWMHDEAVFQGILPGTRLSCGAIHDAPVDPRSVRHLVAPRPLKHSVSWPGDPNP